MNNASRYTAPLAIVLLSLIATMATAIETVSPGAIDRMVEVESRFPTFSWGAEDDAAAYELVAYALPEDATQPVELTADTEVLFTRVVGSATSWTPSADQCFASGGRYVWFVRAVQQLVGDQVIEVSEWSAGRTFQVPTGPSVEDVAQAIEVLKWWQASNAGGSPTLFTATATATAAATVPASAADSGTGTGSGSTGHPKSVQTASAAIKGHNPELDAEAYGVVGTTDSVWGAGVAAVNTEGGPDLVLDGTLDGGADTRLSEWGIDRSDAVDQVFAVANSGGGAITLDVLGTLRGAALDCPGCIVPAALASEAVTSVAIEDGGITEVDIGIDAVNTTHIFDGSVQAQDLAADAVSGAAIADASITTADLADDAVTGAKIQNGAVSTNKLHDGAVTTEKIADDAVGAGQIAFESIGESELADDSVTHSKIVLGAIDT